jgi:hypothetical protein
VLAQQVMEQTGNNPVRLHGYLMTRIDVSRFRVIVIEVVSLQVTHDLLSHPNTVSIEF